MPGADADAVLVEDRREIVRVHAVHGERDHAGPLVGWRSVHLDAGDLRQRIGNERGERHLVRAHAGHAERREVVARGGHPDGVGRVRRPRLEFVWQHVPRRAVVVHELDHVAARLVRWHLLEQRAPSNQAAGAHRPAHLVPAERIEVDSERREVHGEVRRRLRAVEHDHRVRGVLAHHRGDLAHRVDRPDGVRHVRERDDLHPRRELRAEVVEVEPLVRRQLHDLQ